MLETANNGRVLVVDSNPAVLDLVSLLLAEQGCQVDSVEEGSRALRLLFANTYDLIVCDAAPADTSSRRLYEEIEGKRPELASRFLICTGDTISRETRNFVRSKGLPVLHKPFRSDELLRAARPFLKG